MKELFVVVDMQNDFISGTLAAYGAREIVPELTAVIDENLASGTAVVYTRDAHGPDYFDTREGRLLPVAHCAVGTQGYEIADGVYREGCKIFDKPTFGSVELAEFAAREKFDVVTLAGICTDICVISNAMLIKAFLPESQVRVIERACAGVTRERHLNALDAMRACQIDIV